jgi:hypothetical protein
MEKEKIIVARNSYPAGSPSEYLGWQQTITIIFFLLIGKLNPKFLA